MKNKSVPLVLALALGLSSSLMAQDLGSQPDASIDSSQGYSSSRRDQSASSPKLKTGIHAAAVLKILRKQGFMPINGGEDSADYEATSLVCQPDGRHVSCMVLETRESMTLTMSFTNGESKKLYKELIALGATPSLTGMIALKNIKGQLNSGGDEAASLTFTDGNGS
jgi:hypothetical protein